MKLRTATHLGLALLVAVGLSVSSASLLARAARERTASSQSSATKKNGKKSTKKATPAGRRADRRNKGQQTPTADRITEIQQALTKDGSYSGTPTGKWDDSTVLAMKKFQEAHGLNPTGKVDAKTLQQLGLGSTTTGVAAPMPPVSSSSSTGPSKTIASKQ